ncbi:hypothetical protein GT360_17805 [Vibrio astriarenae]|uniref:Uncharacterized protein n=1 Tax=Vibrio astriarenae TaxID=1481923 RepID=A0A7Z2T6Y0_9VIBR|nr:hypothetical protein [Vibrio astriarenae]QIA65395.1 hypothetical protein GT360_17805 [Vibrio astriarenae]
MVNNASLSQVSICNDLVELLALSYEPTIVFPRGSKSLFYERCSEVIHLLIDTIPQDSFAKVYELSYVGILNIGSNPKRVMYEVMIERVKQATKNSHEVRYAQEPSLILSTVIKQSESSAEGLHGLLCQQLSWYPLQKNLTPLMVWNLVVAALPLRHKEPQLFVDKVVEILTYLGEDADNTSLTALSDSDIIAWLKGAIAGYSDLAELLYLHGTKRRYLRYSSQKFFLIESIMQVASNDEGSLPVSVLLPLIKAASRHVYDLTLGEIIAYDPTKKSIIHFASLGSNVVRYVDNLIEKETKERSETLTQWLIILIEHACVQPHQLEKEFNDCL